VPFLEDTTLTVNNQPLDQVRPAEAQIDGNLPTERVPAQHGATQPYGIEEALHVVGQLIQGTKRPVAAVTVMVDGQLKGQEMVPLGQLGHNRPPVLGRAEQTVDQHNRNFSGSDFQEAEIADCLNRGHRRYGWVVITRSKRHWIAHALSESTNRPRARPTGLSRKPVDTGCTKVGSVI